MRWQLTIAVLLVCCARVAGALDRPISGATLMLRRSTSGKEKLVFVSKDPAFLFPPIGSPDDPGTGSPGGAILELSSFADPSDIAFAAPPGVGKPGWTSKVGAASSHTYKNPAAAPGANLVKVLALKEGKRIKLVGRGVGLPFLGPQGAIGVRITTGSLRNCVFFGPASVVRDETGRFVAKNAPAMGTDCVALLPNTTTSFGTTTTTTSSSTTTTLVLADCSAGPGNFPTCNGPCAGTDTCQPTVAFVGAVPGVFSCLCYPPGVTGCTASGYPACGGECPGGGACQALKDLSAGGGVCGCVDAATQCSTPSGPGSCVAGVCPPGMACVSTGDPTFICGCGAP